MFSSEDLNIIKNFIHHSVHPPFCRGGDLASNQIFKKWGGGLMRPQLLERVVGKKGGDFFKGGGGGEIFI